DTEGFRVFLRSACSEASDMLLAHTEYADVDFDVRRGYENLKELLAADDGRERIMYLSLAPQWFAPVIEDLRQHGLLAKGTTKLLLEKPFGTDEASAQNLNNLLLSF